MEELVKNLDEQLKSSAFLRRQFVKLEPPTADSSKRVSRLYQGSCFLALFLFSSSGAAPGVRNLLECRILTHKDALLFLPLSRLGLFLEEKFTFCEYPFIATADQMQKAVKELLETLEELTPKINDFFCDPSKKVLFFKELTDELHRDCGEELFIYQNGHCLPKEEYDPLYISKMLSIWYGMRLAARMTKPFCLFFENQPGNALAGIAAYGQKDGELRCLAELPLERICFSPLQKELFLLSRRPNRLSVLPLVALAVVGCSLLLAPLLAGICFLMYQWGAGAFSGDLLYHTSLGGEQYAFLIFPAMMSGILWLCFDTKPLFRLLYGKKLYKAYAKALTSSLEKRLTGILGCLMLSALLAFSFLQGHHGVAFEKDRFTDNRSYFQMEGAHYVYDHIHEAALVAARPMGLSEKNSDYKSVILLLKDGTVIDLYDSCTEKQTVDKIVPLLTDRGVTITEYPTLEDYYKVHPKEEGQKQ